MCRTLPWTDSVGDGSTLGRIGRVCLIPFLQTATSPTGVGCRLAQVWSTPGRIGPNAVGFGHQRTNIGAHSTETDRRPNSAELGPKSAVIRSWPRAARNRPSLGRLEQKYWTDFGQCLPKVARYLARFRPVWAGCRANSTSFGPTSAKSPPDPANFGPISTLGSAPGVEARFGPFGVAE